MTDSCEIQSSVGDWLKTIEMKKFVEHGMFLQMKTHLSYVTIGGNDTQPLRKRSHFKQALSPWQRLHQEAGGEQIEPLFIWSTNNGDRHRVPLLFAGNGKILGSLPKNSKKVKKDETSRGLWLIGANRYLQNFGENLTRMAFTISFYFVTDRSFTADGGLL